MENTQLTCGGNIMSINFNEVVKNFQFEGTFIEATPYGSGHINDTFAAYFKKDNGENIRYILQRINHRIFKDVDGLMRNIDGVTKHLRGKIVAAGGDTERETLNLIPTVDGKVFYKSEVGDFWRAYVFIEKALTYNVVENVTHFYNAGRAFGKFQQLLSDFPAETLCETIADFHNTPKRYQAFLEALEKDVKGRAKDCKPEIDFVLERAKDTAVLVDLLNAGKLPLRVTHNDTKFNNVMIDDATGEGICVIDLDTVMPGLSLYDFGDSIRSGTNTGEEDDKDLSRVTMSVELFENFAKGFLETAGKALTPLEIELLPFSGKIMTLECGIRFLTDYLSGDVYFKVHREGHNLDRTRTQFKLVKDMEDKMDVLNKIIKDLSDKCLA